MTEFLSIWLVLLKPYDQPGDAFSQGGTFDLMDGKGEASFEWTFARNE